RFSGSEIITNSDEEFLFEAKLNMALADWEKFQHVWDELDSTHVIVQSDFPTQSWLDIYDSL
ncbi:hypothetical protein ACUWCL_29540, partial [Klebsiella pneumoniae]|uniref:hypothetical protein n=1 Tax=Klebsiella pneumoniae TaxID=573 RepID=UPI0040557C5F